MCYAKKSSVMSGRPFILLVKIDLVRRTALSKFTSGYTRISLCVPGPLPPQYVNPGETEQR